MDKKEEINYNKAFMHTAIVLAVISLINFYFFAMPRVFEYSAKTKLLVSDVIGIATIAIATAICICAIAASIYSKYCQPDKKE